MAPGQTGYNWFAMQQNVSNVTFAENDFNGPGGASGAILLLDTPTSIQSSYIVIEYNTFEHCGNRDAELDSGHNLTFTHNTSVDCGSGAEVQGTQWPKPYSNVWSYNSNSCSYGTGYSHNPGLTPSCGISAGAACHDSNTGGGCNSSETQDYSGNTVEYNYVFSATSVGNEISEANTSRCGNNRYGNIIPGVYISNICVSANNCTITCPSGSWLSDQ
jgi:hypothetical protein